MDLDAEWQPADKKHSRLWDCSVTFEEGRKGGFEFVEGVKVKEQ